MNEPFLEGVRILDFTQYLAGPSCTRLLVELGADVIKVELAPDGDPTRAAEPRRNGRSGVWAQQNRGKRSLCVDIRSAAGLELIRALVAEVDVVVENYTPGVMARRGLSYDDLAAINPRIVMASISGFGQTGPLRDQTCFDMIAQAYAGIMHMTGEVDGPPTFVGLGVGDVNAGVHAFAAIGYALFRRDRTGRGTHIDISLLDALFHMHEYAVVAHSLSDGAIEPHRQGGHYQPRAPAGRFQGPNGWIVLLCTDRQLPGLWAAMGRPELGDDPRFATPLGRLENRDQLSAEIEAWMATFPSDEAVLAASAFAPCSRGAGADADRGGGAPPLRRTSHGADAARPDRGPDADAGKPDQVSRQPTRTESDGATARPAQPRGSRRSAGPRRADAGRSGSDRRAPQRAPLTATGRQWWVASGRSPLACRLQAAVAPCSFGANQPQRIRPPRPWPPGRKAEASGQATQPFDCATMSPSGRICPLASRGIS